MKYRTNCIHANGDDVHKMVDQARPISLQTFRKYAEGLEEIEQSLGYDTGSQRGGLRLSNDWAVGFYRSRYRNQPCVFMQHSAIEYIWV